MTQPDTLERDVGYRGLITYWSLPEEMAEAPVKAAFDAAGLGKYAPATRSKTTSLRDALHEGCTPAGAKLSDYYVRPGSVAPGIAAAYAVFRDDYDGSGTPVPFRVAEGRLMEGGQLQLATPDDARVVRAFVRLASSVSGTAVGQGMVKAMPRLMGSPLRSTGGIYWLPESARATWNTLAGELVKAHPDARVYRLRMTADADSVSGILDAIANKVRGELAEIDAQLATGKLKDEAKKNREIRARELRTECERLEAELGVSLATLREECTKRAGVVAAVATVTEEAFDAL